jgi:hypothetical protein
VLLGSIFVSRVSGLRDGDNVITRMEG